MNEMMTDMLKSESESSWESWSFNVLVDVLLVDWLLNDFPSAEGNVAGGVEVSGLWLEGSESGSGGLNLSQLQMIKEILWHPFTGQRRWRFCRRMEWRWCWCFWNYSNTYPSWPIVFWNDMIGFYDNFWLF